MEYLKDTSGFYKLEDELLFGPNYVLDAAYELRRDTRDQNTYPVDGWYWFDSQTDAYQFFGLPLINSELNK